MKCQYLLSLLAAISSTSPKELEELCLMTETAIYKAHFTSQREDGKPLLVSFVIDCDLDIPLHLSSFHNCKLIVTV